MEDDDFNWEAFDKEFEDHFLEMEKLDQKMDEVFEWMDVFLDLEEMLNTFNSNMESLYRGIENSVEDNKQNHNFLNGILLVGVVSAYESFVHDFFDACCSKRSYINKALSNIDKLIGKDKSYLNLKTGVTEEFLKMRLKKVTLHDPIQMARISQVLFGFKMPILKQGHTEQLLEQRNLFTHHGGFINGKPVDITTNYLESVYTAFYKLINGYVDAIKKHADVFFEET